MKFHQALYTLFTPDELEYMLSEATLYYTDDDEIVDYMLWLRDRGKAEIRFDDNPRPEIRRLEEGEEEFYTKEAFLQMLHDSKPTTLTYIEVD